MRSAAWYRENAICPNGGRHESDIVATAYGDTVAHICPKCLERVTLGVSARTTRDGDYWIPFGAA